MKITHIINPFKGSNEHQSIQTITFESIRKAKEYSTDNDINVCSIQYDEDNEIVPPFIEKQSTINKSVLDYNSKLSGKKLPLLKDILKAASEQSNADYLIYTNIDIALQPYFYDAIKDFIHQGYDAFAINRRRVSDQHSNSLKQLNQLYAEVGKLHIGYDCFVFKKELLKEFTLGNVCIGIPYVDSVMLFNLIAFSEKFKLFTDKHLTFHIGYDIIKNWGPNRFIHHNKTEYLKVMRKLKNKLPLKNIPGAGLPFFTRHIKWLMNPTFHYPTIATIDFKRFNTKRYEQSGENLNGYHEWLQTKIKLDN